MHFPSVGSWLQEKPAEARKPSLAPPQRERPFGDFRKAPASAFETIYAMFPKIQRPSLDITIDTRPVPPPAEVSIPKLRTASPRLSDTRFRTNAGATRDQVMNFAQSLTSSIFRNSNTLAMSKSSSRPQLHRPPAIPTANSTMRSTNLSSSASTLPPAAATQPFRAATQTSSFSSTLPPAASTQPARATTQTTLPRPAFRKQSSPIPAEEGAFFD